MLLFRMLRLHTCSTGPHWHKMEESKKMNLTIRLNIYMEKATGVVYQALSKLHWKIKLTILLLWALVKKSSRLSGIKNLAIKHRKNCKVTFVHIKICSHLINSSLATTVKNTSGVFAQNVPPDIQCSSKQISLTKY